MNVAPKMAATPSRMTLDAVVSGNLEKPRRILVYGVEGVGKSSFAAEADRPIFVCPEDGTAHLDVPRFPEPRSWPEVLEAIQTLTAVEHNYRHVVFDTLDWIEPLIWQFICQRDKQENIESYGYGRGHVAALDEWRLFVARLERLRAERGMHVILLAHSWIKTFKSPESADFDRYEMKLNQKAAGLLREWSDAVCFANYETYAHEDRNKRVRGISTGARLLFTQRSAAYDAKNRFNLPPQLPLDWHAFTEAVAANRPADVATITARITELLADAPDELREKVRAAVAKAPTDAAYLARVLNRLAATVSTQEIAR